MGLLTIFQTASTISDPQQCFPIELRIRCDAPATIVSAEVSAEGRVSGMALLNNADRAGTAVGQTAKWSLDVRPQGRALQPLPQGAACRSRLTRAICRRYAAWVMPPRSAISRRYDLRLVGKSCRRTHFPTHSRPQRHRRSAAAHDNHHGPRPRRLFGKQTRRVKSRHRA